MCSEKLYCSKSFIMELHTVGCVHVLECISVRGQLSKQLYGGKTAFDSNFKIEPARYLVYFEFKKICCIYILTESPFT